MASLAFEVSPNQQFSSRGDLSPRGHLAMLETFLIITIQEDATGILWVEPRNAVKYLARHRTAPRQIMLWP